MLGYGLYHYVYASGREGDTAVVSLSSRAQYIALYIGACDDKGSLADQVRAKLPKANIGVGCIRVKRPEDLDLAVLREYLRLAGNKAAVAQRLHMSRPALYKRLDAIRDALGVDLDDGESMTSLHVAIMVLDGS